MGYNESLNKYMRDNSEDRYELVESLAAMFDELSSTIHAMVNTSDLRAIIASRSDMVEIVSKSEVILSVLKENYGIDKSELSDLLLSTTVYYKEKYLSTENYSNLDF
jgi:hypothetical protein